MGPTRRVPSSIVAPHYVGLKSPREHEGDDVYTEEEIEELKRRHQEMLEAQLEAAKRAQEEQEKGESNQPVKRKTAKVGRNDPCPCGSGKKYKKCHGA